MIYKLIIKDFKIIAKHGLLPIEKIEAQEFVVNVIVETKFESDYADIDKLPANKCYAEIREEIIKIFHAETKNTIEHLAYKICQKILSDCENRESVELSIMKSKLLKDCEVGINLKLTRD